MSTSTKKVAVIGTGNIGKVVAANLVKSGRSIVISSKDVQHAKDLAATLGSNASASSVSDAIKQADVIVLAVWFDTIKELLSHYATELSGKLIIDPSNPIAPDGNGGFKKIIAQNESAGQIIAGLVPPNTKFAKALGTLGAGSLAGVAFQKPEASVLFYATDDQSINSEVEQLIKDTGFDALRVGGIDQSIRIEVFGDLHEFGALGKATTLKEAKSKI